ncbi:MAG: cytochrome P450 [Actinobacteria bacterium]|nr:cytochrome P450 [Actinomycetota bacterium]
MASGTSGPGLVEAFDAVVGGRAGVDRHAVFERLREELPVFYSHRLESWVATRYEDVRSVLRDDTRFEPPKHGAGAPAFGRSFLQMRGREHNKKVGIVAREMRSQRSLRERLDALVHEIARTTASKLPLGEPVDLREQYAMWVPLLAITQLTGIHEAGRFRDWYRLIVAGGVSSISDPGARAAAFRAREEVAAFLEPIIEERRRSPGNDLVSDLVTAEYDGAPLPHEEIVATVIFLLAAGIETTERVITSILRHVALDPAEWAWLRANHGDPEALSAFSAEALRVYPPVNGTMRVALDGVDFDGASVAAGDKVCVLIVSANRDGTFFDDPHRFDHDRFKGRGDIQFTAAGDILPFGAGNHHCAGSRLAQVEMAHAFTELIARVGTIEPAGELPAGEGFMLHSPPSLPVVLRA